MGPSLKTKAHSVGARRRLWLAIRRRHHAPCPIFAVGVRRASTTSLRPMPLHNLPPFRKLRHCGVGSVPDFYVSRCDPVGLQCTPWLLALVFCPASMRYTNGILAWHSMHCHARIMREFIVGINGGLCKAKGQFLTLCRCSAMSMATVAAPCVSLHTWCEPTISCCCCCCSRGEFSRE